MALVGTGGALELADGATWDLVVGYHEAELGLVSESTLRISYWDGTSRIPEATSQVNAGKQYGHGSSVSHVGVCPVWGKAYVLSTFDAEEQIGGDPALEFPAVGTVGSLIGAVPALAVGDARRRVAKQASGSRCDVRG